MSSGDFSIKMYFQRMVPFLMRYWKLVAVMLLMAGLHSGATFGRVLLAKPFLEKVFMQREGPDVETLDNLVEQKGEGCVDAWFLDYFPEGLRTKRWVRVLASLLDRDAAVEGADVREYFYFICMVAVFLALVLGSSLFMKIVVQRLIVNSVTMDLRNHSYSRLIRMDVGFFDQKRSGDLLARVTADLDLARQSLDHLVAALIDKPIYIFMGLGICMWISWQLSLICILGLPIILVPVGVLARKIRKGATARQQRLGDITDAMVQTFHGIRVIKAFGLEKLEIRDFTTRTRQYFRKDMTVARGRAVSRSSTDFFYTAGIALLLLVLGGLFISGSGIGFGGASRVVTFFLALGMLYQPLKLLVKAYNLFQESAAGAERLFEVIGQARSVRERTCAVELTGVKEAVAFRDVHFAYDSEEVLRGIDLEVPVGTTVAVVGPSGAGKSTLLDMIPRFYDVTGGGVFIDGRDVRDYTLESLFCNLAVVQQDPFLFNTTIRENIRQGRPSATDAEVEAAARSAQVDAFVALLPEGYDTPCGERGGLLSGGERQRVAIARALLKDAPILLLDEATSSLDSRAEQEVQAALDELMKGRTTLVIAHRLSTVRHADVIVVMQAGRVVEQGTHEALMDLGQVYAQLHRMQHPGKG